MLLNPYFRPVHQYLTVWDLVLTPVYLIVLSLIAMRHRDKKYPVGHPLRRYYMPGLWVKFGGAIFIALIYQYYYGGGDTYNFYTHSKIINSSLQDSFATWWDLLFRVSPDKNPRLFQYTSQMPWYTDAPSYSVAVIGAVFGLLNKTSYLPIALLFAYFSFTGIWAMYRTFANIYPKLYRELAIAFLFIPSVAVWGSAVFKDTVCMFALGWMTYTTFRIFINRDFTLGNAMMLLVSFYLVAVIKIYILLAFVPALGLWLLMTYSKRMGSGAVRMLANVFFLAVLAGAFLFFTQRFAEELNRYSLENIAKTAETTRGWIAYASGDEGSGYDLGDFDPTLTGMLKMFPQGVVVTLFRPFLWEARKIIVLFSALEAFAFLVFTVMAIRRWGGKIFRFVGKDPNLVFFLVFSLIFAFAVGVSSYNFGALSRYKIPCLPFYAAFLAVLLYKTKNPATSGKKIVGHTYTPVDG